MCSEFSNANKDIRPPQVSPVADDQSHSLLDTSFTIELEQLGSCELKNLEANLERLQGIIESFGESVAHLICDPLDALQGDKADNAPISTEDLRKAYDLLTNFTLQVKSYEAIVPAIATITCAIEAGIRHNLEELTALKNELSVNVATLHTISHNVRRHLSEDTETLTPQIYHLLERVKLRRDNRTASGNDLV